MLKVTKEVLEGYLKNLRSKYNIDLEILDAGKRGSNRIYSIVSQNTVVYSGVAIDIYNFLMGYTKALEKVGFITGRKNSKNDKPIVLKDNLVTKFLRRTPSFMVRTKRVQPPMKYRYIYNFDVKSVVANNYKFECTIECFNVEIPICKLGPFTFECNPAENPELMSMFKMLIKYATIRALELYLEIKESILIEDYAVNWGTIDAVDLDIYSWGNKY